MLPVARAAHHLKRCVPARGLAMVTATEEFPHQATNPQAVNLSGTKPSVQESTLSNGIKIITYDKGNSKTASIEIGVLSGSKFEKVGQKGSSQVLARSPFIGTMEFSGLKLARLLENAGASVSSYSDREKVLFKISALKDGLNESLVALATTVKQPIKPYFMIHDAKLALRPTYNKYSSSPSQQITEMLYDAGYGELTPLGGSIYADELAAIDEKQVLEFAKTNFVASNVVVTGSGIAHEDLKRTIEIVFDDFPKGSSPKVSSPYVGGDLRIRKDLGGVTHLGLGFHADSQSVNANKVLYNLIASKLGKKSKNSFFNEHTDSAFFGYTFSGDAADVSASASAVIDGLKAVATSGGSIDAIKKKIKLDYALALDGNSTGASVLLDRTITGNKIASLDSVTVEDVQKAAKTVLNSLPAYAVLGTTYGTPTYSGILNLLK